MFVLLIITVIIGIPTGIAVWLTERVDRPRRRAMREAQVQPAE
jgi:ABC-type proline/glycine betaine transport system permease subunit